jgi:hypothetical protein
MAIYCKWLLKKCWKMMWVILLVNETSQAQFRWCWGLWPWLFIIQYKVQTVTLETADSSDCYSIRHKGWQLRNKWSTGTEWNCKCVIGQNCQVLTLYKWRHDEYGALVKWCWWGKLKCWSRTCPSATLPTINPTRTGLELNLGLWSVILLMNGYEAHDNEIYQSLHMF